MRVLGKVGIVVGLLLTLGCPSPGPADAGSGGGGEGGGAAGGGAAGGGAGGSGGGTASGGGAGGGAAGGAGGGGGGGSVTCTAPAKLELLNGRFTTYTTSGPSSAFVDPQTRRLFVWPSSVSSSMKSLVTMRLVEAGTALPDGGARAFVEALPVTGELPTGVVTASTFDPATGRSYALIYCRDPYRYEVEGLAFSDGGVHFTRYASTDAPDANGYLMQELGVSGNQLAASRGNALVPITLSGNTAQWGAEVAGNPYAESAVYDPPNHRTLSVGGYQVLGPMSYQWIPEVKSRGALAANPTVIPMSGTGPAAVASPNPAPRPYVAFDGFNNRLLVTSTRPGMIGGIPVMLQTLFEANLQTSTWTLLGDLNRSIIASRPYATDPHYPQVFDLSSATVGLLSIAKGSELEPLRLVTSGELPPGSTLTAGVRLPDGRVLSSTGRVLSLFDPTTRGWSLVPGVTLPMEAQYQHTLSLDAANSRVLLFGGQQTATATNKVWAIALGTFAVSPLTTTGTAPAPRSSHSAIVANGQLVVAAGTTDGTTALGDVWALDLTSLAWRKLGDVPPRVRPAVIARGNEVWVIGGTKLPGSAGEATIAAVELTTGMVRSVAVQGAWPTRQGIFWAWAAAGDGLVAIDSGDSVDYGKNQLWELGVTGSVAQWRNTDPDAMDDALNGLIGVGGAGCEDALFLGAGTFRVRR